MMDVVILGFGNVGRHLHSAFMESPDVNVVQIYNRTASVFSSEIFTNHTSSLSKLKDADVYIIAIPDDKIVSFSEKLTVENKLVVHTSGSVSMEQLHHKNRKGVFYALQTFSATTDVDFGSIPICVEAANESDLAALIALGNCISGKVVKIDSEKRRTLHLGAVFVNNFVNHLYHISEEILEKSELSFDLLKPLINETAKKIDRLTPAQAQTGPAKRNDEKTISKHLRLLKKMADKEGLDKENIRIYELLTQHIQKNS